MPVEVDPHRPFIECSTRIRLCYKWGSHLSAAEPSFNAPYQPRLDKRRTGLLLKEFAHRVGDPNTGKTTRRPHLTVFRQDALRLVGLLLDAGELAVRDLRHIRREQGGAHVTGRCLWLVPARRVGALRPIGGG
jgi:hypothetical protein